MEVLVTKKIGNRNYTFNFQGPTLFDVIAESERLSFDNVPCCGLCGSVNLRLASRNSQGKYKYVSVKCDDCRADVTFGKLQEDDKTYFLRKKEGGQRGELDWQKYDKNATVQPTE